MFNVGVTVRAVTEEQRVNVTSELHLSRFLPVWTFTPSPHVHVGFIHVLRVTVECQSVSRVATINYP